MKGAAIIVALDVESAEEARTLVCRLGRHIDFYKVGMENLTSRNPTPGSLKKIRTKRSGSR